MLKIEEAMFKFGVGHDLEQDWAWKWEIIKDLLNIQNSNKILFYFEEATLSAK